MGCTSKKGNKKEVEIMLNPMCYDCKRLNNGCKGMMYFEKNMLWNLNNKIRAKFSRLNDSTDNYIYVGLLVSPIGWTRQDYIDIMSYFDCIGFMKISEEKAKEVSMLPTGMYLPQ